ncbi:MAG TPA: redox-sensitive transcriptional activator SoxR [Dehalococcoidia bacterium]|nr:redox-sensitive transcriptional activator SoxR [Dehalococcoidia bacterium]
MPDRLTISELSGRSGVAPSALRYYESVGLIAADRTSGNQRRYRRSTLRRVAVIRAAQTMGVPLATVAEAFAALPGQRDPTAADWERLSRRWRTALDERIHVLERLRDQLTSCIGCGCLSLERCSLFNPQDRASRLGQGARYLLGDDSAKVVDESRDR